MRTEQFNIRLSKELAKDIEEVSRILKINKSEFVKVRLAEVIMKEKQTLLKSNNNLNLINTKKIIKRRKFQKKR